ncbi:uncharacterized protein EV420DRAFT_1537084 [Desarmillaria tabescens]|uniref:Uncharacterized protein n=1 Tax=Armillaria tabescens TaxID=1929756 RepID=A0AA39N6A2_ARMTA|nr:uncharacterized protein EV420DRAFT_1537084 [Desarmillaria tabescens]KAK0459661.1 hypothetical protein EV420DRAFT_1537084 [Desarmillaria tabescens]
MQTLRRLAYCTPRCSRQFRHFSDGPSSSSIPWFVDQEASVPKPQLSSSAPPIPSDAPEPVKELYSKLAPLPHLDSSFLTVERPKLPIPGPPLPYRLPQGRRRRGGTNAGESAYDMPYGLWSWIVIAQVKEGTENRGAIESVVRVVRKTLLEVKPPLPIPPNLKGRMLNEWAMIDAGDFAVHVLSQTVRERYFSNADKPYYHL